MASPLQHLFANNEKLLEFEVQDGLVCLLAYQAITLKLCQKVGQDHNIANIRSRPPNCVYIDV